MMAAVGEALNVENATLVIAADRQVPGTGPVMTRSFGNPHLTDGAGHRDDPRHREERRIEIDRVRARRRIQVQDRLPQRSRARIVGIEHRNIGRRQPALEVQQSQPGDSRVRRARRGVRILWSDMGLLRGGVNRKSESSADLIPEAGNVSHRFRAFFVGVSGSRARSERPRFRK